MDWIRTGKEVYDAYGEFVKESNDKNNPLLPYQDTYQAKFQPRLALLRWQDAISYGSGNNQYTQWQWRLPETIKEFNTVSLVSIDYNRAYFTTPGRYVCLEVQELQKARPWTTLDTGVKQLSPSFIVADRTSPPEFFNTQYGDAPVQTSCKGVALSTLTVKLGDETLAPLVFNATSGTYYCNVLLYFQ